MGAGVVNPNIDTWHAAAIFALAVFAFSFDFATI
jgi:hypothetical protein